MLILKLSCTMLCVECRRTFRFSSGEDELQVFLQSQKKEEASTELNRIPALPDSSLESVGDNSSSANNEDRDNTGHDDTGSLENSVEEPSSKRHKPSPSHPPSIPDCSPNGGCCPQVSCVACLGILEQRYIQHLAESVVREVSRGNLVGMETYCLSIHTPISLSIRRVGMEACALKCSMKLLQNSSTASSNRTTTTETATTSRVDAIDSMEMCDYVANSHDPISESNYVKEGLRWKLRGLLESALMPLRCDYDSPLMISTSLEHASCLRDCIGVKKLRPKLFPRPKKKWRAKKKPQPTPITKLPVEKALEDFTEADLIKEGYFLSPVTVPCQHKVEIQHKSVFVAGRYNKYSRKLPQTPWLVDGVRKADSSVQELICPLIVAAFRASDVRFSSSGREDVDVLMLGSGRPFLLELVNPSDVSISDDDLRGIEEAVNAQAMGQVAVRQLVRVGRDSSALLKKGEEEKRKTYSAVVWLKKEVTQESLRCLDECADLVIQQRTPIRVLHRRTLAVRERAIYSMRTQIVESGSSSPRHFFRLELVTQAGTYIKEFVHGDFGRTQPNVGTLLGCDADILSLDVLDVQLQWPQK